jgi:hypothetical protein
LSPHSIVEVDGEILPGTTVVTRIPPQPLAIGKIFFAIREKFAIFFCTTAIPPRLAVPDQGRREVAKLQEDTGLKTAYVECADSEITLEHELNENHKH